MIHLYLLLFRAIVEDPAALTIISIPLNLTLPIVTLVFAKHSFTLFQTDIGAIHKVF